VQARKKNKKKMSGGLKTALTRLDVVGIGLNATDTIITLPCFPEFDSKMEFISSLRMAGGQVASAMVACQRWGLKTRYVGMVGDDEAADFQRAAMDKEGVEAHWIPVPQCSSQSAYILVDQQSGERTILWRRDARLAMAPEMVREEWIFGARLLHLDGHDTAAAAGAARIARRAAIPVTLDVDNLYAGVEDVLANTDYVLASREFPERLTGLGNLRDSLPEMHRRFGCKVVGATVGAQGVVAWDGERLHVCPGFRVDAVDTTGAGDIFHGAFIYALLQGWPLPRILEFGCAAAALNCTARGARGGIKPVVEIQRLMVQGTRSEPFAL
jgi:sugar/nucleoside kinase (ribokinase family)